MAKDKLVDVAAANQLDISITTVTTSQSWKRQVRGVYSLIYLHAQKDFLHIDDFSDWLSKSYQKHTHGPPPGCKGAPKTSPPLEPTQISDTRAKALLVAAQPLGKIRKGITGASSSISEIDEANDRELA